MKIKYLILTIAITAISRISALDLEIRNMHKNDVEVFLRDVDWKSTNNTGKFYKVAANKTLKDTLPAPGKKGLYFIQVTSSALGTEKPDASSIIDQGRISLTRDFDTPRKTDSPAKITITSRGAYSCSGVLFGPSADEMGIPEEEQK